MSVSEGTVLLATTTGRVFGQYVKHVRCWMVDDVAGPAVPDMDFMNAFLVDTKLGGPHDQQTRYLDCLSSSYLALTYGVQTVVPIRMAKRSTDFPTATNGTRGPATTGNLQGAITVQGDRAGRKYVGTYKVGPIATSDTVAGEIQAGLKTALQTYGESFLTGIGFVVGTTSILVRPAIYHAPQLDPPVAATADRIWSYQVGWQTRVKGTRTLGRGE